MLSITKEFTFDSAHRIKGGDGKCESLHGHTYKLQVTLHEQLKENGMIIDFSEIKKLVYIHVISKLDHKYLNEIPGLSQPTAENIILWIWDILQHVFGKMLIKIKLWETPTSFVTISKS